MTRSGTHNAIHRLLGLLAAGALALVAGAAELHVPGDFATIQAALNAAANSGDEVIVAPGTYPEAIDFHGKAVYLHSSKGVAVTTINATGLYSIVVTCASGEGPSTVLEGFTITGGWGGGMYNSGSSPTVTNCMFSGNNAGLGGGMCNASSSPTVTNCMFSRNAAKAGGGGMCNYGGSPTVTDCTFSGNWAVLGGGMYNVNDSSPTVTNCILWADWSVEISGDAATVTYSDVQGGYAGAGNIDADPLFVDPAGGNFRLQAASPCIDAGDPNFAPPLGETDLDGNKRVWDGNGDGTAIVDMGAYEFGSHCYGDLNCDGAVNFGDIDPFVLALTDGAKYYQQFPDCDRDLADTNGNGYVDLVDIDAFVALLGG